MIWILILRFFFMLVCLLTTPKTFASILDTNLDFDRVGLLVWAISSTALAATFW